VLSCFLKAFSDEAVDLKSIYQRNLQLSITSLCDTMF